MPAPANFRELRQGEVRSAPSPRSEGLSLGGAIIQPESIIRVLCMAGYESPRLYIRNPAAQDRSQAELHRTPLLGTSVNKAASVSVYTGVGTFWGSGEKESDCWDNRRAPKIKRRTSDLLNFYTTTIRSRNLASGYSRGNPDGITCEHTSENLPSRHSGE
jgi:hypothetical protein